MKKDVLEYLESILDSNGELHLDVHQTATLLTMIREQISESEYSKIKHWVE